MARDRDFILPDLGEGLTEAEIVNWLVTEGEEILVDQPIIEVESAKSIVDLPSPFAGTVKKLHFAVGDTIHTGQAIITIVTDAADTADSVPGTALRGDPATASSGGQVEVLEGFGAAKSGAAPRRSGRFGKAAGGAADSVSPAVAAPVVPAVPAKGAASPVVSPLVRKLARDNGLVAHRLAGSGPGGLVMRADVEKAIGQPGRSEAPPAPVSRATGDLVIPITGLRKVVAERMAASRREVPEATIWLDVDATNLLAAKGELEAATGERWSSTALVARFVVEGLKLHPILNSSVDMAAGEIVQHSQINLGIAAQTSRGLMVPVIRNAGEMNTRQLRDAFVEIAQTAKTGSFSAEQLRGGTFTLNNYGGHGVDGSAPIINQPEVGMLGMGRVLDRPWVVDGQIVVRKIMVVSMVFDHRVCDGDIPSEFVKYVTGCIENPISALAGL
ncbi:MAG: 2-oxo acid dehydrogenase subunit E2 [Homoserinimonas sp.]|nr:2-oxo acid dehydrogenase subunit E2 [Homoserinimonas sp.]MCW5944525.1 2-oxo acid dehydrogenase subunit E2 [Cryobacterium sp.]